MNIQSIRCNIFLRRSEIKMNESIISLILSFLSILVSIMIRLIDGLKNKSQEKRISNFLLTDLVGFIERTVTKKTIDITKINYSGIIDGYLMEKNIKVNYNTTQVLSRVLYRVISNEHIDFDKRILITEALTSVLDNYKSKNNIYSIKAKKSSRINWILRTLFVSSLLYVLSQFIIKYISNNGFVLYQKLIIIFTTVLLIGSVIGLLAVHLSNRSKINGNQKDIVSYKRDKVENLELETAKDDSNILSEEQNLSEVRETNQDYSKQYSNIITILCKHSTEIDLNVNNITEFGIVIFYTKILTNFLSMTLHEELAIVNSTEQKLILAKLFYKKLENDFKYDDIKIESLKTFYFMLVDFLKLEDIYFRLKEDNNETRILSLEGIIMDIDKALDELKVHITN